MLEFTVSIYLINKVYEDPVFCCLQSYRKNCLVSSYQSKVQWTLSLQSCITEKKKVCNVYNQCFNIKGYICTWAEWSILSDFILVSLAWSYFPLGGMPVYHKVIPQLPIRPPWPLANTHLCSWALLFKGQITLSDG